MYPLFGVDLKMLDWMPEKHLTITFQLPCLGHMRGFSGLFWHCRLFANEHSPLTGRFPPHMGLPFRVATHSGVGSN